MLSVYWVFALNLTIYIAGIIALARYKKINKVYHPFLICIWIGCINELLTVILYKFHYSSPINSNLYVLLESILIIILFRNLKFINKPKYLFHSILASVVLIWILEHLVLGKITSSGIFHKIYSSFIIVLLSINGINSLIARSRTSLIKNSVFLLCLGFILYFTYKALVQSFWLYGLNSSPGFLLKVFTIMVFINVIANIIYALAVLWMPRKIEYSLPY